MEQAQVRAPDTATLVRRAASGDADAWGQVVAEFSSLVWAVARAHCRDRGDAADVYQTTWLRLVEHIDRLREPAALAGWLLTTARNEAQRVSRRANREVPVEHDALAEPGPDWDTPEAALLLRDEHRTLWQAFRQLPDRCRRLLRVLSAAPESSYAEVAARLDMPTGSVGPTRGRCLTQLRDLLERS